MFELQGITPTLVISLTLGLQGLKQASRQPALHWMLVQAPLPLAPLLSHAYGMQGSPMQCDSVQACTWTCNARWSCLMSSAHRHECKPPCQ